MKARVVSYLAFLSFALVCASAGLVFAGWALALYAAALGADMLCDALMVSSFGIGSLCLAVTATAHEYLFSLSLSLRYPRS